MVNIVATPVTLFVLLRNSTTILPVKIICNIYDRIHKKQNIITS